MKDVNSKYISVLNDIEKFPEFSIVAANAMRVNYPRITKVSGKSRLFKYHPVRFSVLRSDPLWDLFEDLFAYEIASPLYSTEERLLDLLMNGYLKLNEEDYKYYCEDDIADILCCEGSGDAGGLRLAEYSWSNCGEQIFDLSHISAMFANTDASDVPLSALKLPYHSFYVYWGAHVELKSPYPNRFIDGCYIHKFQDGFLENSIEFVFTSSFEPEFTWDKCSLICNVAHDADGAIGLSKYLYPEENENKEPTFNDLYSDLLEDGNFPKAQAEKWVSVLTPALSMAANCLCFISAENSEIKLEFPSEAPERLVRQTGSLKKTERERSNSKLASLGFRKIHLCGRQLAESLGLPKGSNNIPPHWRRGHWRKQRYGEGYSKVKLIWLSGVVVNADKGMPTIGHIYDYGKGQEGDKKND